jgi:hypothetical protein
LLRIEIYNLRKLVRFSVYITGNELVDWIYENMQFEKRVEAIQLSVLLISCGLLEGITSKNPLDVDSPKSVYRFKYDRIKEWIAPSPNKKRLSSSGSKSIEDDELLQLNKVTGLTERDWQLVFSGATLHRFVKDEVIVKQGSMNRSLYRVMKGCVRVEKEDIKAVTVLTKLMPGTMFGEMSVLTQAPTRSSSSSSFHFFSSDIHLFVCFFFSLLSATIVSDVGGTEIYVVDVGFMYRLFKTEPGSLFFFFFLS